MNAAHCARCRSQNASEGAQTPGQMYKHACLQQPADMRDVLSSIQSAAAHRAPTKWIYLLSRHKPRLMILTPRIGQGYQHSDAGTADVRTACTQGHAMHPSRDPQATVSECEILGDSAGASPRQVPTTPYECNATGASHKAEG